MALVVAVVASKESFKVPERAALGRSRGDQVEVLEHRNEPTPIRAPQHLAVRTHDENLFALQRLPCCYPQRASRSSSGIHPLVYPALMAAVANASCSRRCRTSCINVSIAARWSPSCHATRWATGSATESFRLGRTFSSPFSKFNFRMSLSEACAVRAIYVLFMF